MVSKDISFELMLLTEARRGLPGATFLAAPPRERPLTCGAGNGQKGCRVKAALKSIQLPFHQGASETQRSPVRPAGRKALTERQGQDRPPMAFSLVLEFILMVHKPLLLLSLC